MEGLLLHMAPFSHKYGIITFLSFSQDALLERHLETDSFGPGLPHEIRRSKKSLLVDTNEH